MFVLFQFMFAQKESGNLLGKVGIFTNFGRDTADSYDGTHITFVDKRNINSFLSSEKSIIGFYFDGFTGFNYLQTDFMEVTNSFCVGACKDDSFRVNEVNIMGTDIFDCFNNLLCKVLLNR